MLKYLGVKDHVFATYSQTFSKKKKKVYIERKKNKANVVKC